MVEEGTRASGRGQTQSLFIAALIVAAGFLGSRLLGLLRSVIIAGRFGTSPELDAYWVAFRLPDLVFTLLAGATLASAFIPTFAKVQTRRGEAEAWRLASSVLNLVLLATVVLAALAFLLAPYIVPLVAPGLGEETGRQEELRALAVRLTRVMLVSPILFSISGMFMGILNARRHFLAPALAPMMYNLAIIGAALVSTDVEVLAIGVVVGAALHLLVQLPDLRMAGMAYSFAADWRDAAVREVGALMAPRILGLAAVQINFYFVGIFFASRLTDGAISAVNYAWLIVMTPLGIIGMAISTAVFPTLADQAARNEGEMARTLSQSLRVILFLSLPSGILLALLAEPVVVVLLQRGQFDAASTALTSDALRFYALSLFAATSVEIISRGYYALSDTRTPVLFAILGMALNVALAAALVGPLEVRGIALALSISTTAEAVLLYVFLSRRIPGIGLQALGGPVLRLGAATAVMTAAVAIVLVALDDAVAVDARTTAGGVIVLAACGLAALGSYGAAAVALGSGEVRLVIERLRPRRSG
jgi:putative peptidoglycan lipid II flippase